MLQSRIFASLVGLLLLSCGATNARPLRLVDCTQKDYCGGVFDESPEPSWSARREALYWRGVTSILQEMACGKRAVVGRKLAYVARDELSVSCPRSDAQVLHVKDREDGNRLLHAGRIDHVVEFDRADASIIRGGVEVPVSASYYGRPGRARGDSRLEGVDTYLIVETDTMAEVRLVSRAAL